MSETSTEAPLVDATDLPAEDEVVDVFGGALPAEDEGPYAFEDTDWPADEKPAPKAKPVNPFQRKVDEMLEPGTFPTKAVTFTAPAADAGDIRKQIRNAAGERATPRTEISDPNEDGKITVRFRLNEKRRITRAAATDAEATTGGAAD